MNRYWITVLRFTGGDALGLGVGVTARSETDAKAIFAALFGEHVGIADIKVIRDMRDLEQNHVFPNMGNHFQRGIWFPKGIEHWWGEVPSGSSE